MRGKYFSWLSHDDVYLPEKIQVEIDALRKVGDMSRVVYSDWQRLTMPGREVGGIGGLENYRQEFLETGAFAPLFGLISGCTLLIPKIYFDAYGGFDETFRAVQDYKKWFEMFRGKRLVYVRQPLILSRQHAEQTTYNYSIIRSEEHWLYSWMAYNLHKDDLVGSGLTDMYNLYSALFTKWYRDYNYQYQQALPLVAKKILELPESPDIDERIKIMSDLLGNESSKFFLPEEEEYALRFDFTLRGITLGDNVKFIPFAQLLTIKPDKNVWTLNRNGLLQLLIDTPIRKEIFKSHIKLT